MMLFFAQRPPFLGQIQKVQQGPLAAQHRGRRTDVTGEIGLLPDHGIDHDRQVQRVCDDFR